MCDAEVRMDVAWGDVRMCGMVKVIEGLVRCGSRK